MAVQQRVERESLIERAFAAPTGAEEAAQIQQLFPTDDTLIMKSEIPPGLIIAIARAYTVAHVTKSKVLRFFCDMVLKAQVSKDRKGRVEMMEAMAALRRQMLEELTE